MEIRSPYGLALVFGTIGYVATMALHPVGITNVSAEALTRESQITVAVHALGLLSLPVVVFGLFGLSSRAGWHRPSTQFAFITYCLSVVAVMLAAAADGLIGPALVQKTIGANEALVQSLRTAFEFNYQVNQAFAKVFVVGAAIAIISWSYAVASLGSFERRVAWFGWFVGAASLAGLFSGHVRMDVHGFGAIVLLQAVWNIALGVSMMRSQSSETLAVEVQA
jgi:hypothetical protein